MNGAGALNGAKAAAADAQLKIRFRERRRAGGLSPLTVSSLRTLPSVAFVTLPLNVNKVVVSSSLQLHFYHPIILARNGTNSKGWRSQYRSGGRAFCAVARLLIEFGIEFFFSFFSHPLFLCGWQFALELGNESATCEGHYDGD